MMQRCNRFRQLLLRCLISVFTLSAMQPSLLFAQSEQDFEAPVIEHERISNGDLGETQVFTADVVDNIELKAVFLFYRFAGEEEFSKVAMDPIASSTFFSTNIATDIAPTDADGTSAIEYYIQAEDTAGNIVLKGYIFDPIIRTLTPPGGAPAIDERVATAPTADDTAPAVPTTERKSNSTWYILGLLGLLAVGAAVASSGGDDAPPACDPSGCVINLQVGTPRMGVTF